MINKAQKKYEENKTAIDSESLKTITSDGNYAELWSHHNVGTLIRRTKDYIIHVCNESGRIDWETSKNYDDEFEKFNQTTKAEYNAIICDIAVLESRPSSGFSKDVLTDFRVLLGEALVCAFKSDFVTAKYMILAAGQYIDARSQELSRRWYLLASLSAALPCACIAFFLWGSREYVISAHGETVFLLLMASMAGAIGALFSVLLRTGRLHLDCASGMWLHNLEGFSRIMAGAISGVLVALAIKAELIFQIVLQPDRENFVIILLALISGVSERFAASIIEKIDGDKLNLNSLQKESNL